MKDGLLSSAHLRWPWRPEAQQTRLHGELSWGRGGQWATERLPGQNGGGHKEESLLRLDGCQGACGSPALQWSSQAVIGLGTARMP